MLTTLSHWFGKSSVARKQSAFRNRNRRQPKLEALESRNLMAAVVGSLDGGPHPQLPLAGGPHPEMPTALVAQDFHGPSVNDKGLVVIAIIARQPSATVMKTEIRDHSAALPAVQSPSDAAAGAALAARQGNTNRPLLYEI